MLTNFGRLMASTILAAGWVTAATAQDAERSPVDVDASISIGPKYIDNIFDTANDKVDDVVTIVAPAVEVTGTLDRFKFGVGAEAEIGVYGDNGSEDYEDFLVTGDGEVRLTDTITLFGGADHAWEHEERSSPDDVNGEEPTEYRDASGYAGLRVDIGRISANAGANVRGYDFDDTPAGGGEINNDDRDRVQAEFGGRVGYDVANDTEVFVQGIYDVRDYEDRVDDFGFERDSDGVQAGVGVKGRRGAVSGEVKVGVIHQDFDDNAFDNVTTIDVDADVLWRAPGGFRISGFIDRSLEETTLAGASSYTSTAVGMRVRKRIAGDLSASAYFVTSEDQYNDSERKDYLTDAGFGLRYFVMPNVFVGADYEYSQRLSNVAGAQFDRHAVFARAGVQLDEAYDANDPIASASAHGFYLGLQAGHGSLLTSVDGPRGGGGDVVAEFGEAGFVGGPFIGYRAFVGDFMLGAELDAELGEKDWFHDAGRDFGVRKKNQVGLSGLIGTKARGDALLYGRFGVVSAEFESEYAQGANFNRLEEREIGLTGGVGAEFPIGGGLSARMEYVVAGYNDYNIGAVQGGADDDNFANLESTARIGLVYSFGMEAPEPPPEVDFGGFYVGVQGGHGTLESDNTGPRPNAIAPVFIFDAVRSGQGFTGGGFAGFGHQFGDIYLGVEADAEVSNADWNIERDPEGRIYSVDKEWSVGASARAGYVLNDAVLLYGRAGVVGTQFQTNYEIGANDVKQDDFKPGLRVGGGAEIAVSDNATVRLDYTRTEYESYTVDYNVGVDKFRNAENLFRVGVAYRF